MCYMSLSVIAFSPALAKKSDEDQRSAVQELQEYLDDHPDIWRHGDQVFEEAFAWKPVVKDGDFKPQENLRGQVNEGQKTRIRNLGFDILAPV